MLSHPNWHSTCPSYTFFVPHPCFTFALQTMKKESFCRKQFPGPAALGLILPLQLPRLLYARTPLPPPSTPPSYASNFCLSQVCLTGHYRPCNKLLAVKMPWPERGARASWEKGQESWVVSLIGNPRGMAVALRYTTLTEDGK